MEFVLYKSLLLLLLFIIIRIFINFDVGVPYVMDIIILRQQEVFLVAPQYILT